VWAIVIEAMAAHFAVGVLSATGDARSFIVTWWPGDWENTFSSLTWLLPFMVNTFAPGPWGVF